MQHFKPSGLHPDAHQQLHREWDIWMDFKNVPPHRPIRIPAASLAFSADKQRQVINELDVEHSPRYKAGGGKTYCNIFVSDFLDAMGLPPTHIEGGVEFNANMMIEWLGSPKGEGTGWVKADRADALDAAARGHVVLVAYYNHNINPITKRERPGHIAIVLPEGTIAQAGRQNFVGKTIREGFGTLPVVFYVQTRGGSHAL